MQAVTRTLLKLKPPQEKEPHSEILHGRITVEALRWNSGAKDRTRDPARPETGIPRQKRIWAEILLGDRTKVTPKNLNLYSFPLLARASVSFRWVEWKKSGRT